MCVGESGLVLLVVCWLKGAFKKIYIYMSVQSCHNKDICGAIKSLSSVPSRFNLVT